MRVTSPLTLRAAVRLRDTKASPLLVSIDRGTFYRYQPLQNPSPEEASSNRPLFPDLQFSFAADNESSQYWCITGPSNAGKTTLLEIVRGQHLCFPPTARSYPYLSTHEVAAKDKKLRFPAHAIQYVGFDGKKKGLSGLGTYMSARYESRREITDFTLLDFLTGNTQLNVAPETRPVHDTTLFTRVMADLELEQLLDMPVTNLSNGQSRRARIAKALLSKPELLLLDEPFMGLDPPTTLRLSVILKRLAASNAPRVLLALRPQDPMPDWITHVMHLGGDLTIRHKGTVKEVSEALQDEIRALKERDPEEVLADMPRFNKNFGQTITETLVSKKTSGEIEDKLQRLHWRRGKTTPPGEPIIELEGVKVNYNNKSVLGDFDQIEDGKRRAVQGLWWTVCRGQRWGVFGPNGSGKTTLLSLILSDHPQAYSAPIKLFGRSRLPSTGQPGISLFDIQSRIGHSSPEVHAFFPRKLTLRKTLESAYADTPLSRPRLTAEADARIDACLRWFQGELNPALGMQSHLKDHTLRRTHWPGRGTISMQGNSEPYRAMIRDQWFTFEQNLATSVEWADNVLFGELSFSAQRVTLFLRAVIASPDIVILDEAFGGMDDLMRDKCLVFLQHGESHRLTPYEYNKKSAFRRDDYTVMKRIPYELDHDFTITTGLTERQALVVVSHVKEEVPECVRNYVYLPASGSGQPCKIDKIVKNPLRDDAELWASIWGLENVKVPA